MRVPAGLKGSTGVFATMAVFLGAAWLPASPGQAQARADVSIADSKPGPARSNLGPFAACDLGNSKVTNVTAARHWAPVTPAKWRFTGGNVILAQAGVARPGPRRPFEYAVLTAGPRFGSVQIEAEVRIDVPVQITNRDVILVFGYRSDTEFYYVHLSTDNTIYAHNGIFVVNKADRLRIDHQWNGSIGAPPAITDANWHRVRVVHCAATGEIEVYLDGSNTALMTAKDTTLSSGRVGFGSFDNVGRLRKLTVTGTAVTG